ncbi:MAG: hypothetical protein K2X95_09920 [Flavobacteriaceae bacterium]|nr:hypothetical protein [Flavobacteriaceae bacterium]
MNKFLGIFIISLLFLSCSSDLDFKQVNDFKSEPIVVANLASFDIQANQFVIGGVEQPLVGDVMNFKVFNDVDFINNISRTDLYFEFTNTINRAYNINLYLLDANNVKLYTIPFVVPAYTPGQSPVTKTEVFENAKLDILKQTQKIAFIITMLPGPPLTNSSLGSLKLRSSATIYFAVQ